MLPILQTILIIIISFSIGLLLGGWFVGSRRNVVIKKLQYELSGTRVNFHNAREDAHDLRGQLKVAEEHRSKLSEVLESTSGHKKFSLVRKKLEVSRREIQLLKAELNRREQVVFDLRDVILTLKKHLHIRPQPKTVDNVLTIDKKITKVPVIGPSEDNLQLIDGISDTIAHQLHSLGIVNYRQIAECGPRQLLNIQRLIGQGQRLPLRQWVIAARRLSQQKYDDVLAESLSRIA